MNITQPEGNILLFSPSYSGKSYLTEKFQKMGLRAYDLEKEGPYVCWVNDYNGKPVIRKPKIKTSKWLSTHHFLMDIIKTRKFLSEHNNCIVFAHSWNIMDCLDIFTHSYFLYLNKKELMRRMKVVRPDHSIPSSDQINFMIKKHADRYNDVKNAGVKIIDATLTPLEIYNKIIEYQKID